MSVVLLLAFVGVAARVAAQIAGPPEIIGPLVGPLAPSAHPGLRLYGTDLGWTYEHQGRLFMLFGQHGPTHGRCARANPTTCRGNGIVLP